MMVGGASWASWKQSDEQQEQEVGFPYKRSPQVTSLYLATDRIPYNESSGKECEYEFFRNQTRLYLGPRGGHDLLAAVSIDAWKSADDNEEGEVLANVLLTAHGDMIVDFHDNGVRMHQPVLDHIRAAEETLKQIWQEKVCQYSGKIVCATVLTIPRSVMDQINDYLNADTEDAYQGEDNTITYTAHFPDGKEMDVKCCGCRDESSWTEAVLFDKNGAELCCSEPADEYDGTWTLENEGVEYIVYIAVEK